RTTRCHSSTARAAEKRRSSAVGGAFIAAGIDKVTTNVNYGYAEVVGGAKITVAAKGSITQAVKGPLVITVGGAILRSSQEDMSIAAKSSRIRVGAIAKLASDE